MRITRSYIRNLERYIHPDLIGKFVRVVSPISGLTDFQLERIGLEKPLEEGESYLPPPVGRTSRFNADGKWIALRNEPKEKRYIRTVHWTWKQFTGGGGTEDVEDSRDIYRMCYPRDLILPPSEEIFGFPIQGIVFAATEAVSHPDESDKLLHQINLMLELFKECEIVSADGTSASPARTNRRWVFLPSGPYKSDTIASVLSSLVSRLSDGDKLILAERQEFLTSLDPQEVAQGQGGFNDYLAYVFPQYGRVVLESLRRDNAIYIFKGAWERFSKLTKRQILDHGVHDARILHTKGWQSRLLETLKSQ